MNRVEPAKLSVRRPHRRLNRGCAADITLDHQALGRELGAGLQRGVEVDVEKRDVRALAGVGQRALTSDPLPASAHDHYGACQ